MKKAAVLIFLFVFASSGYAREVYLYEGGVSKSNYKTKTTRNKCIVNYPDKKPFKLISEFNYNPLEAAVLIAGIVLDPYVIPIDGSEYVLIKDKTNGKYTKNDILGINNTKNDCFNSLIKLDKNKDQKVDSEELKAAKIRLAKIDAKGVLTVNQKKNDFDVNKINYIDLTSLKKNANCEETGIFGHFNVSYKNKDGKNKIATGYVTFDEKEGINKLINGKG